MDVGEGRPGCLFFGVIRVCGPELGSGLGLHEVFDLDHHEQGSSGGYRAALRIVHRGREIQFAPITRPNRSTQYVWSAEQNRRQVVELETPRHGELTHCVEQEAEQIVENGRHRAAVCYPGCPDMTLIEHMVSHHAVLVTLDRQGVAVRVLRPTTKTVGVVGR